MLPESAGTVSGTHTRFPAHQVPWRSEDTTKGSKSTKEFVRLSHLPRTGAAYRLPLDFDCGICENDGYGGCDPGTADGLRGLTPFLFGVRAPRTVWGTWKE